ncbi:MAG: polysaccharide deacetylase family protein [Pirellulaceae bacterium]|nr:polysaccharide deacetylase family protein [Pirellulaceae bacterium]
MTNNLHPRRVATDANPDDCLTRRRWISEGAAATVAGLIFPTLSTRISSAAEPRKAQIAITLDLEMSRNFPNWADTSWDYEKGNLNEETKRYSVEAAHRVKDAGSAIHFFAVGRVLEQQNVDWLRQLAEQGHPIGNHTYDHVNVLAKTVNDVQFRFQRSPWLVEGKTPTEIIRENVRLCSIAMKSRLKITPNGFRTPGGFATGLKSRPDVRSMLQEQGFDWVSSLYPAHRYTKPKQRPDAQIMKSILSAQANAQPFAYPDGLVEIPMSPISDIGAFRTGQWKLEWFLDAIRETIEWTIDNQATFDFLAHPSCLYVVDPTFKSIELICELVEKNRQRATLVDLGTIARHFTA